MTLELLIALGLPIAYLVITTAALRWALNR